MMWMMISFPLTYFPGFPVRTNLIALGTLNQISPVAIPVATSVVPIPVENAPRAPYVQVWESAPMMHSPATTTPASGGFDILVRRKMIRHKYHFILVKYMI